jgi:hypothetical protein
MTTTVTSGAKTGRIGHAKSKNGCIVCKIRRVKCDEVRPHCKRCTSTGRKCDYKPSRPDDDYCPRWTSLKPKEKSVHLTAERALSTPNAPAQQRRAFEFFFVRVAPALAGSLDADFWSGVVLQLSRSHPVIWDAIIAISCLYEHPQISATPPISPYVQAKKSMPVLDANHRLALHWYSRALANMSNQLPHKKIEPVVTLCSCILFICIELMQDNIEASLQLLEKGAQIISKLELLNASQKSVAGTALLQDIIVPLYFRQAASSTLFGTNPAAVRITVPSLQEITGFRSLSDARSSLYRLIAEGLSFQREAAEQLIDIADNAEIETAFRLRQQYLLSRLREWRSAFVSSMKAPEGSDEPYKHPGAAVFDMHHATLFIGTSLALDQDEMAYDRFTDWFERMVRMAPFAIRAICGPSPSVTPRFTFENGAGFPLAFVVAKCRDPRIRRDALALLLKTPSMEGLHKSFHSARAAAECIAIEEGLELAPEQRLAPPLKDLALPEQSKRIVYTKIRHPDDNSNNPLTLYFTTRQSYADGSWRLIEHCRIFEY